MMWNKQLTMNINDVTSIPGKDEKEDEDRFLAVILILRSDFNCFIGLTKDLLRDNTQGPDKYPTTTAKAY